MEIKTNNIIYEIRETSKGSNIAEMKYLAINSEKSNEFETKVYNYPGIKSSEAIVMYLTNELIPYIRQYKESGAKNGNLVIINNDIQSKNFLISSQSDRINFGRAFLKTRTVGSISDKTKGKFIESLNNLSLKNFYKNLIVERVDTESKEDIKTYLYNEVLDPIKNFKNEVENENETKNIQETKKNSKTKKLEKIEFYIENIQDKKYVFQINNYENGSHTINIVKLRSEAKMLSFYKHFETRYNLYKNKNNNNIDLIINDESFLKVLPPSLLNNYKFSKYGLKESAFLSEAINKLNQAIKKDINDQELLSNKTEITESLKKIDNIVFTEDNTINLYIFKPKESSVNNFLYLMTKTEDSKWEIVNTINGMNYNKLIESKLNDYPGKENIIIHTNAPKTNMNNKNSKEHNVIIKDFNSKKDSSIYNFFLNLQKNNEKELLKENNVLKEESEKIKSNNNCENSLTAEANFIIYEKKIYAMIKMRMENNKERIKWVKMKDLKNSSDLKDFISRHLFNPQINNPEHNNLIIKTNNEYLKSLIKKSGIHNIKKINNIELISTKDKISLKLESLQREINKNDNYGKLANLYRASSKVPDKDTIIIYTDGSIKEKSDISEQKSGYGIAIRAPGSDNVIYKIKARVKSNNNIDEVEAFAIKRAIEFIKKRIEKGELPENLKYEIRSDSLNNISALNGEKGNNSTIYCKKLHQEIKDLSESLNIDYKWVKGHHIDPFNKLVDKLADESTKHKNNSFIVAFKDESLLNNISVEKIKEKKKIKLN